MTQPRVALGENETKAVTTIAINMLKHEKRLRNPPQNITVVRTALYTLEGLLPQIGEARELGLGNTYQEILSTSLRIAVAYARNRKAKGLTV